LLVSKQALAVYGVCEVWKQELCTLIAIISGSAFSWFSANYTIDEPGRVFIWQIPRGGNCLLLTVTGSAYDSQTSDHSNTATDVAEISNIIICVRR